MKISLPRWLRSENFTRQEKAVFLCLLIAVIWGIAGIAAERLRSEKRFRPSPGLYAGLLQALPDRSYLAAREIQLSNRIFRPDPGDAFVFNFPRPKPGLPGEEEIEVSEEGWIFFPKDYYTTISINEAGLEELIELPGIGPATAGRILEYRERYSGFAKRKDLMKVRGIGEKTYLKVKDEIRIY